MHVNRLMLLSLCVLIGALILPACGGTPAVSPQPTATTRVEVKPTEAPKPTSPPVVGIPTIKVAIVDDFSGPVAEAASDQDNSFLLAVDEANAKGGINGRKIEVVKYDDGNDNQKAVSFVRRAADEDKALALIGCSSSSTCTQEIPVVQELKLPFIIGAGAVVAFTEPPKEWAFRVGPHNGDDAGAFTDYIVKHGFKKPGIINSSNAYALDGGNALEEALKKANLPPVAHVVYESQAPDVSPQAITLLASNPDVVVLYALAADGGRTTQTLRQVGFKGTLMTPRIGLNDAFRKAAGASGEGVIIFNTVNLSKPGVKEFFEKRAAKYGPRPSTMYVALGWDQALVLFEGLKSSAVKQALDAGDIVKARQALRDAIEGITKLEGLEGNPGSYFSYSPTKHHGLTGDWFSFLVINSKGEFELAK